MAEDRQLSRNFWLHEFPCWEEATEEEVARLQETVARVLQPIRDRWGRIVPTSWIWWRDSCTRRSGAHDYGGTVDFVALDADLREVWEWGRQYLLPAGYIGRWIYEPQRRAPETPQEEHIHMAPVQDMVALRGDREIQALEETSEGRYALYESFQAPQGPLIRAGVGSGVWGILLALGLLVTLALGRSPAASSS